MYKEEIRRMRPSAAEVKQEMIRKVTELKSQREAARRADVAEKMDRRFKESADELRKIESDIKEIETKHERDVQMVEKQRNMERQYAEEMIYAELWRRDVRGW